MSSSPIQHISTLSTPQQQVVNALAQGSTITAAAEATGIHRTTVHNWIKDQPDFAKAVLDARAEVIHTLRDQLKHLSFRSLATLQSLLDDPNTPHAVRLKTALAILERPAFPSRDWALPERVGTPVQEEILKDIAVIEADYTVVRMEDVIKKSASRAQNAEPGPGQIPRSAPCPCGSGEKYKRCCGRDAPPVLSSAK